MSQPAISIYCPNPLCQATNDRGKRRCDRCTTLIPHRYLWVIDPYPLKGKKPGDLVADRYCLIHSQVVLDTKPSHNAIFPDAIDEASMRYAEMFRFRLNVPQVYGFFESGGERFALLENSAIYPEGIVDQSGIDVSAQLMPRLMDCWETASDYQKLTWMHQITLLWQPLGRLGKTGSILDLNVLRVDGDIVKVLYLQKDPIINPSLANFAEIFLTEIPHLVEEPIWGKIFHQMIQQEIISSDQLLEVLDHESQMIHKLNGSSDQRISISTLTNRGPSRQKNEDACYPASESSVSSPFEYSPLVVVCDGIGGHEGGSFASNTAIATITTHLQNFQPDSYTSEQIIAILEAAVCAANDTICDRNDAENRQERQRMGTTIVLAFLHDNHLFITHIGDSRAYRISQTGCYQVTLDDDLASRETLFGHSFYREALQYPGTGSLTQALGMAPSSHLQPTTTHFILNQDCVFLLCSDGLSDFDRVDESWQAELLPVLQGQYDVYSACQRLIEVANTKNGHDNVTVGLLHFKFNNQVPTPAASSQPTSLKSNQSRMVPATQVASIPDRGGSGLGKILAGLIGLGLVGGGVFWWWHNAQNKLKEPSVAISSPSPTLPPLAKTWNVGQFLEIQSGASVIVLLSQPGALAPEGASTTVAGTTVGTLQPGSIVQVAGQWATNPQETWVKLKVCTVSSSPSGSAAAISAGVEGWQTIEKLGPIVSAPTTLPPERLGDCKPLDTAPPIAPTGSPTAVPTLTPSLVPPPEVQPSVSPLPPNQAQ